jgi:hypothetical protein
MRTLPVLALLALAACVPDTDRDGTNDHKDCGPADPAVHPDAIEACNGRDDDCDGHIDEDVAIVAYWDRDGDGFGDPEFARRVCALPADGSTEGTDCDDADASVFPGAPEACDDADQDCDGEIDEGAFTTFYADADGDGHGSDEGTTIDACIAPSGYATSADDCDDADPRAWTDAPEACDGADNDCDGAIDEDLPVVRVWADADGDGHGDPLAPDVACGGIGGFSADDADCDDTTAAIGPDVVEIADNGADEDCDGWIDEIAVPDHVASLGAALLLASDGDVIQLGPGTWPMIVDLTGRDVTLAGTGCDRTVIYGNGLGPVVTMDSGTLTGLSVAGGRSDRGGGVRITGGEPLITSACIERNIGDDVVINGVQEGNGAGIAVDAGTLHLVDSKVTSNAGEGDGGGVYVGPLGTLDALRVDFRDNGAISDGGGIYVAGDGTGTGTATVRACVFAANRAGTSGISGYGGAIAARSGGDVTVAQSTFEANTAGLHGEAIAADSDLAVTGSLFADQAVWNEVIYSSSLVPATLDHLGFWRITGPDTNRGWLADALRGDPRFLDATGDPVGWDLHLLPGSAAIDAGDPAVRDPDGTTADLGAYGGPDAPADFAWTTADDSDADGLPDGWELAHGSNRWVADAGADADGDGLDAAAEYAADLDPMDDDSDHDGVSDAADGDPHDPRDHRPIADAGVDGWGITGEPVAIDGWVADPDGTAPIVLWTLVEAPPGSAVTGVADPGNAATTLVPDVPGSYRLRLDASDLGATASAEVTLHAYDALIVPDDAATLADALALASSGDAIALRPGNWEGPVDAAGRDLAIIGLGTASEVVVSGGDADGIVFADAAEDLVLAQLTVRGGLADQGGAVRVIGGSLVAASAVLSDSAAVLGGCVYAEDADVALSDVDLRGCVATDGGGLAATGGTLSVIRGTWANDEAFTQGGGAWISSPLVPSTFANTVFADDRAPSGAAIWRSGSATGLVAEHLGVVGVAGLAFDLRSGVTAIADSVLVDDPGTLVHHEPSAVAGLLFPGLDRTGPPFDTADVPVQPVVGDPAVVARGPSPLDLTPRAGSPLLDAGTPWELDPDGTRSDIGPGGGPSAHPRVAAARFDTDGDGLVDAWEALFGTDPQVADGAADPDGDGIDNLGEQSGGTDPLDGDTDGDGLADGTDPAPLDPTGHVPVADAGADVVVQTGTAAQLDGSASVDPDGDALSYRWTILARPVGSAVTDADLVNATTANPAFTPDVHGAYRLALVVSDARLASPPDQVTVEAWSVVRVPADAPTVADAFVGLSAHDHVEVAAGTWSVSLAPEIPFVLVGTGVDQTILTADHLGPTLVVEGGIDATVADLTLTGGLGDQGGALDCDDSTLTLTRVALVDSLAYQGGGLALNDCTATLSDVDVVGNQSRAQGGGIYLQGGFLTWSHGSVADNSSVLESGGGLYSYGVIDAQLDHVAFTGNRALARSGSAIYQIYGNVTARHLAIVDNHGPSAAYYVASGTTSTKPSLDLRDSVIAYNDNYGIYFGANTIFLLQYDAFAANTIAGASAGVDGTSLLLTDPGFASLADLHLRDDSALIDAADPATTDPDGSRADIGLYGGAGAEPDFDAWYADTDGDGLADGWEREVGLDPLVADATTDADGDGLDATAERALGTDPFDADSDADGVPDDVEAGTSDPADPSDHRPVAEAGNPATIALGPVAALDGSRSTDPDGDTLGFAWSFAAIPGTSALGPADLAASTTAFPSFTPDVPGAYVLALVVDDGVASSLADTVRITVQGDVSVPADYGDVAAAVDAVAPGFAVHVASGTWPCRVDLAGKDVALVGAGSASTVLDGEGGGPILTADSSEDVALTGLTLTRGLAPIGGAARIDLGTLDLDDVVITGNVGIDGGGIWARYADLTMTDAVIEGNRGSDYGGGLYLETGTLDAVRLELAANEGGIGGAVYAKSSDLVLEAVLVHDNVADAGAAFDTSGSTSLRSTLFADHLTAVGDTATSAGLLSAYYTDVDIENSVIEGEGSYAMNLLFYSNLFTNWTLTWANTPSFATVSSSSSWSTDTTGDVSADPLLQADFTPGLGSPAIDGGNPASTPDRDGSTADLGATGGPEGY